MSSGSHSGDVEAEEVLKELGKKVEQMRGEAKEISEQAKSGADLSSLRERLNDLKARAAQARQDRENSKQLASQEASSARDQLLHRRENLRKNLENVDRTLSLRQVGKQRLQQIRERYVKELRDIERKLQSIPADR